MISEVNQKILELFSESPDRCVSVERLEALLGSDYQPRINNLLENRFIEQADCVQIGSFDEHFRFEPTCYRITILGRDALTEKLSAEKQMAKKRTRQKNQRAADARQQMLDKKQDLRNQFLVAAFSVALTLLVEHFGDVVDFARNVFKTIFALFH